eukprot:2347051-Pyramimonas_sp.AAC.1
MSKKGVSCAKDCACQGPREAGSLKFACQVHFFHDQSSLFLRRPLMLTIQGGPLRRAWQTRSE